MATLFRDLEGGYLVPYLEGKTNEKWQSTNTPQSNVQLSNSPVVSGQNSVLISPGLVTPTDLVSTGNGSIEFSNGVNGTSTGWNTIASTSTKTTTAYEGKYAWSFSSSIGANGGVSGNATASQVAGTYTVQVAIRLGTGTPPNGPGAWVMGFGIAGSAGNFSITPVALTTNYQIFTSTITTNTSGILKFGIWNTLAGGGAVTNVVYYDNLMVYAGNYGQVIPYANTYLDGLYLSTSSPTDGATTPAIAAIGTQTLDLRITFDDTGGSTKRTLISQLGTGTNDRFSFGLDSSTRVFVTWTNAAGVVQSANSTSTASPTVHGGCRAVITLTAGTVDWYNTFDDGGTWNSIGVQSTGLTTTAINTTGTAPPVLIAGITNVAEHAVIRSAKVIVGGTPVIDMNFATANAGNGPWVNPTTGETWTRTGNSVVKRGALSLYIDTAAYSPVQYDLTNYDGVGMFMYCPQIQFLDHVQVRFYTEDPITTFPSYFEINVNPLGEATATGTQTFYGTGLYGSSVYSVVGVQVINWTELIIPKENFTVVGSPSWAKITRTEIKPVMLAGGLAPVYVDAISGWVNPLPEDNSANRIMNRLPNFYWDTDYYRQLCQEVGYEMDCLKATARFGLDQRFVDFAEWGLRLWEDQYGLPVEPASPMLKRRALVKSLFAQMGSKAEFIDYLSDICDAGLAIHELYGTYVVLISAGVNTTSARNQLVLALSRTIPAHLQATVSYNAFVAGVSVAGSGLGPTYFDATGESASFVDNATKTP